MIVVDRATVVGRVEVVHRPGSRLWGIVWDDGRPLDRTPVADRPVWRPAPPAPPARPPASLLREPLPWLADILRSIAPRERGAGRRGHPSNAAPGVPVDGAALRARREAVGLSQRDLAAASRVSRSLLSDIERGARPRASARTCDALDQALRRAEGKGTAA